MSAVLRLSIALVTILAFVAETIAEPIAAPLPSYSPSKLTAQTLTSVGSDSMGGLMQRWIKAYSKKQPSVEVRATSKGSASAPPALIEGSADLGPMARQMKTAEQREFLIAYGFAPTQIQVAYAAVGVYVPKNSPVRKISISQLRQLFSAEEENTKKATRKWSAVSGFSSNQPITLYGQIGHQYLAGYLQQKVLLQKPYSTDISETASPGALYEVLSKNPGAIGFAAVDMNYPRNSVRMLAVSSDETEGAHVLPSDKTIANASYPLSRSLNIFLARQPNQKMEPGLKDFLTFILSKEGQKIVAAQGLIPLSAPQVAQQRLALQ